jgi:hypothetical protein
MRAMLQDSAAIQLNDYFEFVVGEPRAELDGAPEGGSRYPVEARMDGRVFARFHVDIGIGDEVMEPVEVVEGRDWLGFGGIAPPSLPITSASRLTVRPTFPTRSAWTRTASAGQEWLSRPTTD